MVFTATATTAIATANDPTEKPAYAFAECERTCDRENKELAGTSKDILKSFNLYNINKIKGDNKFTEQNTKAKRNKLKNTHKNNDATFKIRVC